MRLAQALRVGPREVVALVGAGGKTSALFLLAQELLAGGRTVIATTTTHMLPPADPAWPVITDPDRQVRLASAARAVVAHGWAFIARGTTAEGKLAGIPPNDVQDLARLADVVLVEADGARGRHLKAPAAHEPAIPLSSTLVVPLVGLQSVGEPLSPAVAHRVERLAALLGTTAGSTITVDALVRLLQHPQGGLRGAPPQARVVPLCNQADTEERRAAGRRVAAGVQGSGARIRHAVVGAVESRPHEFERWERSAVVILAAGAGRRYGGLKQAEMWAGRPLISRAVAAARMSLATEVLVVLGCRAERLATMLGEQASPGLRLIVNAEWEKGQASSIRAGLQAVTPQAEAVVFCNADQPLLSTTAIDALLVRRALTGATAVAYRYQGELRSPALFARPLFGELAGLTGDTGGRVVLERHRDGAESIEIEDLLPFTDVDTPSDYLRLRRSGEDACPKG